jgi:hypothetical protein
LKPQLKIFLTTSILLLAFFDKVNGQVNLVSNGSFETYSSCPSIGGEIFNATGWDSYNGTVDYYHSCATNSMYLVPNNSFGYQVAHSGNAFSGLITYWDGGLAREVMGIQLSTSLTISQKYYFSFYTTLAGKNNNVGYSSNKLGLKFSKVALYNAPINNTAHYFSNNVISDTINWTNIFGSFIADSAYKNLMIGNFFDNLNTTIINNTTGTYAYYFIDDVCVSTDSAFCKNYVYVGIKENTTENMFRIFPNPASNSINIPFKLDSPLKIFNSLSQEIEFITEEKQNTLSIDCSTWRSGLYFIQINNFKHKIIINH